MQYPMTLGARLRAVAGHLADLVDAVEEMDPDDPYSVLEALDGVSDDYGALTDALCALEDTAALSADAELMADASSAQIHAALGDWE